MLFRRTLVGTIVVLALLVTGFAVLDRAVGPRLSSAQLDTAAVVSQPEQALRLFLNQRVAAVRQSQLTVSPAASAVLSSSGQLISVQFAGPLRYGTTYRVRITGVTSSNDGQASQLDYSFRTPSPSVYYLHRGSSTDEIFRTGVTGTARSVVFSATRIQDFAVIGNTLAVVTLDSSGNSSLSRVTAGGVVSRVTLPGPGTIDLLGADQQTGILGFAFTSSGATTNRRYSSVLFTVDTGGTGIPRSVLGLDHKPLSVLQWYFVPGTTDVVAQAADGSILETDPTSPATSTPFGSYLALDSVSTDGRDAVVSDNTGPIAISLRSGKHRRLVASDLDGARALGGAAQVVPGGWLQIDSTFDSKLDGFAEHLAFDDGSSARDLFHTANPLGAIDGFSDSPNNEYVAVETIPDVATSTSDDYVVDGRSTSVTTAIVDVANGSVLKSVLGFDAQWGD